MRPDPKSLEFHRQQVTRIKIGWCDAAITAIKNGHDGVAYAVLGGCTLVAVAARTLSGHYPPSSDTTSCAWLRQYRTRRRNAAAVRVLLAQRFLLEASSHP